MITAIVWLLYFWAALGWHGQDPKDTGERALSFVRTALVCAAASIATIVVNR
jgi:hypothetical protein